MEILIAIVILYFCIKYVLFHVKINSVVCLLMYIGLTVAIIVANQRAPLQLGIIFWILLLLNIADCIRDLVVADEYYENISDEIDKLFAVKSVSTAVIIIGIVIFLFVVGCLPLRGGQNASFRPYINLLYIPLIPRAFFFLVIYRFQKTRVLQAINEKIKNDAPLPSLSWCFSNSKSAQYYYKTLMSTMSKSLDLVSNDAVVNREWNASRAKLDAKESKKLKDKIVMNLTQEGKKALAAMDYADNELNCYGSYKAAISRDVYNRYAEEILPVLKAKNGAFSPGDIKAFPELKHLNFYQSNGMVSNSKWADFFIIGILQEYAKNGLINQYDFSDKPLENHQYGVSVKSRNASDDPRLALDDD